MDISKEFEKFGLIPTVAIGGAEKGLGLAKALIEAGLPLLEVMFRTEGADEAIRAIVDKYPDFLVGAGTIKNLEQAKVALAAGAKFIVCPGFDENVTKFCMEQGVPITVGCTDATTIQKACQLGVTSIKYFPAEPLGGVSALSLLKGAFPEVSFIATGGIDKSNFKNYIKSPAICAVGGGFMMDKSALQNNDFDRVRESVEETRRKQLGFYIKHVGINCGNEEEAIKETKILSSLLGLPMRNCSESLLVGQDIEVMKQNHYGTKGHLAIASGDMKRAYYYFENKGIEFIEDTRRYSDQGDLTEVYLKGNFAGFAIHLLQE